MTFDLQKSECPAATGQDATNQTTQRKFTLTKRQARVLQALLTAKGWTSREQIDRISGASNGPAVILALRRKVTGHDGIQMERFGSTDRDGQPCHPGAYKLAKSARRVVRAALTGGADHV